MDKRDFSAADVLTAVQTINHHVKDLQKLAKYIDFCLVSERCSNEQVQFQKIIFYWDFSKITYYLCLEVA